MIDESRVHSVIENLTDLQSKITDIIDDLYSMVPMKVNLYINGKKIDFNCKCNAISYEQIVQISHGKPLDYMTVVYRMKNPMTGFEKSGSVIKGTQIAFVPDCVTHINVANTNSA